MRTSPYPSPPSVSASQPRFLQMLQLLRRVVTPTCNLARARIHSSHQRSLRPTPNPTKMNATQAVLDWISAHPYQTAFHVVNGAIICTPAAASVPLLAALGFGTTGPVAGMSGYDVTRKRLNANFFIQAQQRLESCRISQLSRLEVSTRPFKAQPWAATEPAL